MSAVEALAEVLREHYRIATFHQCACGEPAPYMGDHRNHVGALLVAAIRSMPAEQKADVVDGEVEMREGTYPHQWRVITDWYEAKWPWLPLGVSPETNGEQK